MRTKKFAIAEETICTNHKPHCTCVHIVCPYCGNESSFDMNENNMPEYFSVICEVAGKIFLAHRAQDEKLEEITNCKP